MGARLFKLTSLVITVASNQHLIASSLHEAGFIDYLGDATQSVVSRFVMLLLVSPILLIIILPTTL